MKGFLLFLAGLLLGANVVYFVMRGPATPTPTTLPADAPTPGQAAAQPAGTATTTATPAPSAIASAQVTPTTTATPAVNAPAMTSTAAGSPTTALPAGETLLLPVQGIQPSQLHDTFNEARGGGTRPHEALDIMAPRGTPVLAAIDGTVEKLFTSVPGGLTIYEFDRAGTRAYYYAHLDRYAEGLAEGQALRRGDVIGYVGSTGNAAEDAPHLHFAIFVLGPEKHWWQGTAIDPYPLLAPAAARD
jgi:murein DD-endopeptidase MepM/ murein hydrolase activator NlpD